MVLPSLVILAASIFEILCGKTDRQTDTTIAPGRRASSSWPQSVVDACCFGDLASTTSSLDSDRSWTPGRDSIGSSHIERGPSSRRRRPFRCWWELGTQTRRRGTRLFGSRRPPEDTGRWGTARSTAAQHRTAATRPMLNHTQKVRRKKFLGQVGIKQKIFLCSRGSSMK